jgi:competence CoiA-like predicted nuclease
MLQAAGDLRRYVSKLGVIGNMKYALINGKKTEATKGARGFCRSCGEIMIARCGDKRVDHWAHKAHHKCDSWWEKETEWHRNWKENFPDEWQEIIHKAPDGEKHIADVKTKEGCVLEFQHSYFNNEERSSRNDFYKKLIWVVDGVRRKTDEPKFQKMIDENSTVIRRKPLLCRVESDKKCKLLKEWHTNKSHVFFDFQKPEVIWFLFSSKPTGVAYLTRFSRAEFIELHRNNKYGEMVRNWMKPIRKVIAKYERNRLSMLEELHKQVPTSRGIRATGFQKYLIRKRLKKGPRRF